MADFGFDPSIILQGKTASLSDMLEPARQMQQLQAQRMALADMARRQQQEQAIADVYRQNAGNPGAVSQGLMNVGAGQQALGWMDHQSEMDVRNAQVKKTSADLLELAKQHVRNQVAAIQNEDQYKQFIDGADPQHLAQMGLPTEYDPVKLKTYVAGGIPAEKQIDNTENERHHRAEEARPTPSILAVGPGGNQFLVDPRKPTAAAVPVLGPDGEPLIKPTSGAAESKEWTALMNSVSTTRGKGNKTITDLQNRLFASDRVKAAATNPDGSPKNLSPEMLTELAGATAALISQGHPPESMVHALSPKGWGVTAADLYEKLNNAPTGAGQTKYVQMMLDLAKREERVVGGQMRKAQADQLGNFIHLRAKDPNRFNGILEGAGMDPTRLDEKGLYRLDDEGTGPSNGTAPAPPKPGMVRIRDPKTGRTGWAPKDAVPAGAEVVTNG